MTWQAFLIHLLFTGSITLLSAMATFTLARHLRIMDIPTKRSSHTNPVPRGGGLAIVFGFLFGLILIYMIDDSSPIASTFFVSFLSSLIVIAAISLFDDIKSRPIPLRLALQFVAISFAMAMGIMIDYVDVYLFRNAEFTSWIYPFTFIWIFGLTNAYNFMDGLDGMAATTGVIASAFFAYITFIEGSHFIYLASLAICGATLGFLIFNWQPARIFMGDIGSTFLGFTFAAMSIIAARYDSAHTSLLVIPLLLFHFIFDTSFTVLRRLLRKENILKPHREFCFHLLHRMGYSHKQVTQLYAWLAIFQGIGATIMISIPDIGRLWVFVLFFVLYTIAGLAIVGTARKKGIR